MRAAPPPFSTKENKRLVLIDAAKLVDAEIFPLQASMLAEGRNHAFSVNYSGDQDDKCERMVLAVGSEEEYVEWTDKLKVVW